MNSISKRLRASIAMGAYDGDTFERGVCAKQMMEAADTVDGLRLRLRLYRAEAFREAARRIDAIDDYPHGYSDHADAMDAVYVQVRDLLEHMADETEQADD